MAYAIAGTMRFDIENDALGKDHDGNPITLKDIWPSDEEIDAIVAACVKPEQFSQIYNPMFDLGAVEKSPSPLYDWRPQTTYIRRPPYWEGALAGERTNRVHTWSARFEVPDSYEQVYDVALDSSGDILGPLQRVDVPTALRAMTLWPAWQHFEEKSKGSIEVGKLADFVVLSRNPLDVEPGVLADIEVLATIKEGDVVYAAPAVAEEMP